MVCWPSRPPEETVRESNCWLCRGDHCRPGTRRLVGRVAAAVELGFWPRRHEAGDGFVPRCPRLCAHISSQRLAPCVCGWLHSANRRCARSEPGPVQSRSWHRSLVGAAECGAGTLGGLIQGDKRDATGAWARRRLARAQPLRRASLHRDRARRPCRRHGGVCPAHLPDRHQYALRPRVNQSPSAAELRWHDLRCQRDHPADRSDAYAPQASAVVATADHGRLRDHCAAPAVRRIRGISRCRRAARPGSRAVDD